MQAFPEAPSRLTGRFSDEPDDIYDLLVDYTACPSIITQQLQFLPCIRSTFSPSMYDTISQLFGFAITTCLCIPFIDRAHT